MKNYAILFMLIVAVIIPMFLTGFAISADKQHAPVVVATVPTSGDMAVDPSLKEISVTFSEEMLTNRMWSWVMESKETFPKMTAKPRYLDDKKTCVLPVKLEPGKSYIIWINSAKHNSFRNKKHQPAVPYLLKFKTKQ